MKKAIEVINLSIKIGDLFVLENVTFSVDERTFLAIIGPNGGGKTTLLKAILGLIKPYSGEIRIFGEPPETGKRFLGYLPQMVSFDMNFPMTVFDVVMMGAYRGLFKRYSSQDREKAFEALKLVEMEDFKDRYIGELSGGQRQRVLIARALVRSPRVLLLDEPTTGIDFKFQKKFYELLKKLKDEMTIVMVTHDVGVIGDYVDAVACINCRLFYHGEEGKVDAKLREAYGHPIEVIVHKNPQRILGEHIWK